MGQCISLTDIAHLLGQGIAFLNIPDSKKICARNYLGTAVHFERFSVVLFFVIF